LGPSGLCRLPRQFAPQFAPQFLCRSLAVRSLDRTHAHSRRPTTTTRRHTCCLQPAGQPASQPASQPPLCRPAPVLARRCPCSLTSISPSYLARIVHPDPFPSLARATPTPAPLLSPSCMTRPFAFFLLTRPLVSLVLRASVPPLRPGMFTNIMTPLTHANPDAAH
jgi:hypothetical protein